MESSAVGRRRRRQPVVVHARRRSSSHCRSQGAAWRVSGWAASGERCRPRCTWFLLVRFSGGRTPSGSPSTTTFGLRSCLSARHRRREAALLRRGLRAIRALHECEAEAHAIRWRSGSRRRLDLGARADSARSPACWNGAAARVRVARDTIRTAVAPLRRMSRIRFIRRPPRALAWRVVTAAAREGAVTASADPDRRVGPESGRTYAAVVQRSARSAQQQRAKREPVVGKRRRPGACSRSRGRAARDQRSEPRLDVVGDGSKAASQLVGRRRAPRSAERRSRALRDHRAALTRAETWPRKCALHVVDSRKGSRAAASSFRERSAAA